MKKKTNAQAQEENQKDFSYIESEILTIFF